MICHNLIYYAFHIKIYLWHVSIRQIPLFCEKSSYKAIKMRCPHFKTNNCDHNLNICRVNIFHTSLKMATGYSFRLLTIFSVRTQSVVCFVVEIFFTGPEVGVRTRVEFKIMRSVPKVSNLDLITFTRISNYYM